MNHHPPYSDRRFLDLPAISPCSAISPSALLSSLSSLTSSIVSFPPNSPTVFLRASREAARQSSIILAFLADLRPFPPSLPPPSLLSLSDLHITLQKLHFLLSDCSRRGARLLALLLAPRIAAEFRALLRSVASALEILPLGSIPVSADTRDLIRLLAAQAARADPCLDPALIPARTSALSILALFRSETSPDPDDLRRLLNRIKIRSWADCFAEVAFLEEEILAAHGPDALLWSAYGLTVYSLVTVFGPAHDFRSRIRRGGSPGGILQLSADGLRCPISLEVMRDPVTVSTGQTYDRSSIFRWLKSGNRSCPVTGADISRVDLIPNVSLQRLISLYCHENCILTPQRGDSKKRDLSATLSPASSAAAAAVRMAASILVEKLDAGDSDEKNLSALEIRLLTKSNLFNRVCLVNAGAVRRLLRFLPSSDPLLQENAVAALLNLSKQRIGRAAVFESGGLGAVIRATRKGHKLEVRQNAAAILFYLSSMAECRAAVGELQDAIPCLVGLLKDGTYRGKKNAVVAIHALLSSSSNQDRILDTGTVPAIAGILESAEQAEEEEEEGDDEDLLVDCVGVLAKIAERPDGAIEILNFTLILDRVVQMLRSSSSSSSMREYCVSVLLSVCCNGGEKAVSLLMEMPLLMPLLYSLLSDESRQARKKARSLLNFIHGFNRPCFIA